MTKKDEKDSVPSEAEAKTETPTVVYKAADKKKIKRLQEAGVELSGNETPDVLDTLIAELEVNGEREPVGEAEVKPGVPNNLPVRTETIDLAGKKHQIGVFFVAAVKGGFALYDYQGKRVSPAYGPEDTIEGSVTDSTPNGTNAVQYINRAAAKFNAMRRKNIIPGETIA